MVADNFRCGRYKRERPCLSRAFRDYFLAGTACFLIIATYPPITLADESSREETSVLKLNLATAIAIALRDNRTIITSRNGITSQQFSLQAAQSAFDLKLVPSGTLGLSGGELDSNQRFSSSLMLARNYELGTTVSFGPTFTKEGTTTGNTYTSSLDVAITQPLLKGFGRDYNLGHVLSSEYAIRNAERTLYQTRVTTVLTAVSHYLEAVRQEEILRLNEALVERLQGQADMARAKERVGLATPMDTYRAEIRLKDAENAVIHAETTLQDTKDQLKATLSLPMSQEIELTDRQFPDRYNGSLAEAIDVARQKRIDLEQLRDDLNEAERKVELARHNILPDLNLVTGYSRYGTDSQVGQSTTLNQNRWWVNLQGSTDLYRTAEQTAYQQSLIAAANLRLNYADRQEQVTRDVRRQFALLKDIEKRIENRRELSRQAEGKLELAAIKFAYGMADNFDLIESETELQRARTDLLSAQIDLAVGMYAMRAAVGTLLER